MQGDYNTPSAADTCLAAGGLTGPERQALALTTLSSHRRGPGDQLVRDGDPVGSIFFLAEGWACRFKLSKDGHRQISLLLAPGDVCNLDALLFPKADYGVCMLTAGTVLALPRERAVMLADRYSGIARRMQLVSFVENATLTHHALRLGRQSAREKVAHFLCELGVRLGYGNAVGETTFELPLTQEHIGDALGLTAVHVNRTLRELRLEGLLTSTLRRIVIKDIAALRRLAGFCPRYLHLDDRRFPAKSPVQAVSNSLSAQDVDLPLRPDKTHMRLATRDEPLVYAATQSVV